jgi:hypothetical protein
MGDNRHFQVAGLTIRVESDLPITGRTFSPRLKLFEATELGEDAILVRHHFGMPGRQLQAPGEMIAEQRDLAIYRCADGWVYSSQCYDDRLNSYMRQISFVNSSHTRAEVHHERDTIFCQGDMAVFSFFPSDWFLLARVLADRQGCMFHSSGMVLDGRGLLFIGHSGAGKSTMVKMLQDKAEVLCDERNIVRRGAGGFRLYGTWTHGEIPIFSPSSAPLAAILFLKQAGENRLNSVRDKVQAISRLSACAFKPLVTVDWWKKTLSFMEELVGSVPCYQLEFDQSGEVSRLLRQL